MTQASAANLTLLIGGVAALLAVVFTVYTHREIGHRLKNPRERWFLHIFLFAVAIAFALVSVIVVTQSPEVRTLFIEPGRVDPGIGEAVFELMIFLVAVGLVHFAPAAILFLKNLRERA